MKKKEHHGIDKDEYEKWTTVDKNFYKEEYDWQWWDKKKPKNDKKLNEWVYYEYDPLEQTWVEMKDWELIDWKPIQDLSVKDLEESLTWSDEQWDDFIDESFRDYNWKEAFYGFYYKKSKQKVDKPKYVTSNDVKRQSTALISYMNEWDTSMLSYFIEANWDCLGLNKIHLNEMINWTDAKWDSYAKEQVAQFHFWTCVKSYWTKLDWELL